MSDSPNCDKNRNLLITANRYAELQEKMSAYFSMIFQRCDLNMYVPAQERVQQSRECLSPPWQHRLRQLVDNVKNDFGQLVSYGFINWCCRDMFRPITYTIPSYYAIVRRKLRLG